MENLDTEPREKIWQVVAAIPRGKVCTYGRVAELAGLGRAARMVGRTLQQLPAGTSLPWHRVINAQGRISFPAGSDNYRRQSTLLATEGVTIPTNGRISLRVFGWPQEEN